MTAAENGGGDALRIASVQKQKRGGLYHVYGENGELLIACSSEIRARFSLYEDSELTPEALKNARREQQRLKARETAASCLARRSLSKAELMRKLRDKGISPGHARDAVEAMQSFGYLDDERYAAELCEYLFRSKMYGARRVKAELLRRGIDRDLADEMLERLDTDPEQRAADFIRRKYKGISGIGRDDLKKIYDRLLRNGYSYSEASCAIKAAAKDEALELDDDSDC